MSAINDYWDALDRLRLNAPIRLQKGVSINKDTVALEAGRKRGSIKKSRLGFSGLIAAIELASVSTGRVNADSTAKLDNARLKAKNYRELYHQSLNRELMLIERLAQLEKELKRFANIVPIFRA